MNIDTLAAAREIIESDQVVEFAGKISSYNMNTHAGRVYLPSENRTVAFEIAKNSVSRSLERVISRSLDENIAGLPSDQSNIIIEGIYFMTKSGELSKIVALNARLP